MHRILFCFFLTIFFINPGWAEEQSENQKAVIQEEPTSSATEHSIQIDGRAVKYTATVGWLIMKNDEGKPACRFGYTAYTKNDVDKKSQRPIMFAFNGGPGSSSIWLHMGILGPRRVVVTDEDFSPPPPSEMVDNEYSIIDMTDLVMIDPVGTGFSKTLGDAKTKDYWGVDQDIKSVGAFIKQYVTENGRWGSPKYIMGESYGGIRSAGLVWHMQKQHNMNFNGVIMVSPILNVIAGFDTVNIDLPYVLYLSSLAATAWYHDAISNKPADLQDFLDEVDQFAYTEYAPALMKGYTIANAEKQAVAEKLARFTGTSTEYWLKADLRISHMQFLQELKRDDRLIAGRMDSRFLGPSINPLGELMDYDPFVSSVGTAFTAAFMDYLHTELNFGQGEEYIISGRLGPVWDWHHKSAIKLPLPITLPWADTLPDLSMALSTNPGLHLMVQQGYFDLATPISAMKYYISHLDIAAQVRDRIQVQFYEAGHMMYIHEPSMKKFRDDLVGFIEDTDRL